MSIITAISPQRRNTDRMNVHVDGRYAFSLHVSVAGSLEVGQQVTDELLATVNSRETLAAARASAERYLSYRPRSIAEVRRNLLGKKVPDEVVALVLEDLAERHLLDDAAFARYWFEQRESFRPRAGRALRQELAQKGVSRHIIDEILADQDDLESARSAGRQRLHRLANRTEEEFRLQLGGYLQRRGFGYSTVRKVVADLWQEADHNHETHQEES